MGAVITPVAGGTAYHHLGTDPLQQGPVDAVPLAVVAQLEQVGPQLLRDDGIVTKSVGVPGQQDAETVVFQPQDQAGIVHSGIQSI